MYKDITLETFNEILSENERIMLTQTLTSLTLRLSVEARKKKRAKAFKFDFALVF